MKKIIITVLFLGMVGFCVWYFFFNQKTEEELIKDQLLELADACSRREGETAITMAMKNSRISNLTADSCSVSINETMINGTYTAMEFAGSMTRARALFKRVKGSFDDVEITVNPDEKNATVDYSVRVIGQMKKGRAFDDVRELRSELCKEDGKWKFSSFEIREVLER